MKPIHTLAATLVIAAAVFAVASCSGAPEYDAALCEELAVKIERRDSLSQQDYAAMIAQNEAILRYLVDESRSIGEEPEARQNGAWRQLYADPEYMERFGYMFTLGSTLYQADIEGRLDQKNKERYAALDKYNDELADYSER